jgi:hypothetical protein
MTRHNVDYKKIRTDIINGKKRCIYMKPKGKREYVKSGGEFVLLSAYIKTLQKKNKKKGGAGYIDKDGKYIDRETIPATVLKNFRNIKATSKSFMRGLMGKGLEELVPDSTKVNSRVRDGFRAYNENLFAYSKFIDTERRQEARVKAHKLGSKIRKTFLGNNDNSEEHAPQQFTVAQRSYATGRRAHVNRPEVRAELVFLDSSQGRPTIHSTYPPRRPTAPSRYPPDGIGFA